MPWCQRWEQGDEALSVIQMEDGIGLAPHRTSLDLHILNQLLLHASHAQVFMHKTGRTSKPIREPNYHSRPGVGLCGQVSCQNTGSSGLTRALLLQAPDHSLRRPALQFILSAQSHPPTLRQCDATASRAQNDLGTRVRPVQQQNRRFQAMVSTESNTRHLSARVG